MGCYNSIVVNAPVDQVWSALKNFHDMSWSPNLVTKVEVIGDKASNEVGAKRVLNDAFHETLLSLDDDNKTFTYSIDDGPAAASKENVSGYVGEVRVFPVTADGSTFVLWTSEWESSKEGGVAEFCNPIYQGLLEELRSSFS